MNFEDYVQPSSGADNLPFDRLAQMFLEGNCRGRYHWGKAGWAKHIPCFDGAATYGEGWCDFGCAVSELDPTDKFAGESWVWHWNATREGQPVEFSSCCTPEGFNKAACACASSRNCIQGYQEPVSANGVAGRWLLNGDERCFKDFFLGRKELGQGLLCIQDDFYVCFLALHLVFRQRKLLRSCERWKLHL